MKETTNQRNTTISSSMASNLLSTRFSESQYSMKAVRDIKEFNQQKEVDLNRTITDSDSASNEEKQVPTDLDESSSLNKSKSKVLKSHFSTKTLLL